MAELLSTKQFRYRNSRKKGAKSSASSENDIDVGGRIRQIRMEAGLSIRALAEASDLNVNTLSLIENGKTSPSVSTLQRLATTLKIPLTAFFETEMPQRHLAFQKNGQRPRVVFSHGVMEDLGAGLTLRGGQPLIVILEPHTDSGSTPVVHTGHEFVFCLEGCITYFIEDEEYGLEPGDSLIFEAHLPHRWGNLSDSPTRSILLICPTDETDHPSERHFSPVGQKPS